MTDARYIGTLEYYRDMHELKCKRIAELEAENVRLKDALGDALEALDDIHDNRSNLQSFDRWYEQVQRAKDKARAALTGAKP
jgi:hypothetical protein